MTTILKPPTATIVVRGIPAELRRAVRIKALQEGKSLQEKVRELFEAYAYGVNGVEPKK